MPSPLRPELRAEPIKIERGRNYDRGSNKTMANETSLFTSAIVRELHVYGQVAKIKRSDSNIHQSSASGNSGSSGFAALTDGLLDNTLYQHRGYGKALLAEAEKICKEECNLKCLSVISAVGTRDYYRKFGYTNNGPYLTKRL
jgi:elongator complex protein 3